MKQVTLNIPDNKFEAFMQTIKDFAFIKPAHKKAHSAKNRKFTVIELKNKDFKFNRDELNER